MNNEEYFNKTQEQQFEEAKSWFKENGTSILVAITLFAAVFGGWNFWKNHQTQMSQESSATYQSIMDSYSQDPVKNAPLVEKFIAENGHSSYVVFAQLEQAKQAVEKGDFSAAKTTLQSAVTADDPTLQAIARFRLATVDYQLKNYDEALATLAQIQDKTWDLRKQVLTGDILVAKGDKVAAKSAYEQARSIANEQESVLIELRLNNL